MPNSKLTHHAPALIGTTIAHVGVKKAREDQQPAEQVFLLFTDGTYYEIHTDSMLCGISGPKQGDFEMVQGFLSKTHANLVAV